MYEILKQRNKKYKNITKKREKKGQQTRDTNYLFLWNTQKTF